MAKIKKYYSVEIELSNGNNIRKNDVRAMNKIEAWDNAYDEDTMQTLTIYDDEGTYYVLTKAQIVQVIVKETDSPEVCQENIDGFHSIF